jgi:uncharacterized membrane protein
VAVESVGSERSVESLDLRAEVERISTERLIFFSDAVVAIAITLLALELPVPGGVPVPGGMTNHDLLVSLQANLNQYVAFLISFVVIAGHWRGHHHLFRYVDRVGPILRWNLLWLLFIVIMPFATRVLNGEGAFQVRFILYAVVQALAAASFLLVMRGVRRHDLLKPGSPPNLIRGSSIRLIGLTLTFLLSIPLAFVTHYAYFFWIAVPLAATFVRRLTGRPQPESD